MIVILFSVLQQDIKRGNKIFILGKSRLVSLFPKIGNKKKFKQAENFEILETYVGKDLEGKTYVPLFPYFKDHEGAFKVMVDTYVTDDSGTGIVHQAPAFGEDDYRVCVANSVVDKSAEVPCPGKHANAVRQDMFKFLMGFVLFLWVLIQWIQMAGLSSLSPSLRVSMSRRQTRTSSRYSKSPGA